MPNERDRDAVWIGAQLRRAREARDWTLEDLQRASGFTGSYLAKIERGEVGVPLKTLLRLTRLLHLHWTTLVDQRAREDPDTTPGCSGSSAQDLRAQTRSLQEASAAIVQQTSLLCAGLTDLAERAKTWQRVERYRTQAYPARLRVTSMTSRLTTPLCGDTTFRRSDGPH